MTQTVTEIDANISHVGFRDRETSEAAITAYFETEEVIRTWREIPDHFAVQEFGCASFHGYYSVEIAQAVRAYRYPDP